MDEMSASQPASPEISNSSSLKKALDVITEATEEDKKRNYEEAVRLYGIGCGYLLYALKYEATKESTANNIRKRLAVYVERNKKIKEHLERKYQQEKHRKSLRREDSEEEVLSDLLERLSVVERPYIKWCNVFGLREAKGTLQEALIMPLKFPQLFNDKRQPWKSILLYGPPGTGKTSLAYSVATEVNSTFIPLSNCLEESERLFKNLRKNERSESPTIIFIDEIDVLFSSKSADRTKGELLTYMKDTRKGNDRVLILATANEPWNIKDELLKGFEKKIYTPLPSMDERLQILKHCLDKTPHHLSERDLKNISDRTEGYSGGDISVLVRDALMQPVRRLQTATHFKTVSGPSRLDPNSISHNMLSPCQPDCSEAMEMSWEEVPRDYVVLEPLTDMNDFLRSLTQSKPTTDEYDLRRYEYFQKDSC